MSVAKKQYKRVTVKSLVETKANGEKISMLTAYDYTMAKIVDGAGIDVILVGDSASNVMAGHETTALALTWTWVLLAQNPEIEKKLPQEIQTVLQKRSPTAHDIDRLKYASWIIKESMRLYPPAWGTSRQVVEKIELGGYVLEPGDTVFLNQWVMHRNPRFFKCADQFKPQRWENGFEQSLPKGIYFPFGDGPRSCIGKGFAMMEAILILVAIAQKFRLTLLSDNEIELQPSITLRPKHSVLVNLQKNSCYSRQI